MHRGPLWQFYLSTAFVVFVVHRGALGVAEFGAAGSDATNLVAIAHLLQAALGAVAAVGIWRGGRWVIGPIVALGALVALTAILAGPVFGLFAPVVALGQVAVAILVTGGLVLLLRAELRPGESNAERAERAANDPQRRADPDRGAP